MTRKQFIDFAKRMTKAFVDIAKDFEKQNHTTEITDYLASNGTLEIPAAFENLVFVKDYHSKKNQSEKFTDEYAVEWTRADKMKDEDFDEILDYFYGLVEITEDCGLKFIDNEA